MDIKETGCEDGDWTYVTQDRDLWQVLVNTVMNCQVLQEVGYFLTS